MTDSLSTGSLSKGTELAERLHREVLDHLKRSFVDKDEIVVASMSCNSSRTPGERPLIVKNLLAHDPDLLFFAGDQTYHHTEHTAGCFELKMGSMRILLDYSAAEVSRGIDDALLRYTPLAAVDAGACPAAYESDLSDGAPKWRARPFDRHWLVEGESRIELPPQEGLDVDSIDLLVVSSPEEEC